MLYAGAYAARALQTIANRGPPARGVRFSLRFWKLDPSLGLDVDIYVEIFDDLMGRFRPSWVNGSAQMKLYTAVSGGAN